MLSIAHAAAGSYIAATFPDPLLAVPLILLSHYLADAVPHWDTGTGLSKGTKTKRQAFLHEISDLMLTAIVVMLLYPPHLPLSFSSFLITPYLGAFLALVPDFLEAPRNFLGKEPWFLRAVNRFHHSFHHSIPRIFAGLAPQIILLGLIWYFH